MNRILKILLSTLLVSCLLLPAAFAEAVVIMGIAINDVSFPDSNFKKYVSSEFDTDGDGVLSDEEIKHVSSIDISGRGIASLKGIEFFTSLSTLNCGGNKITELDLSSNPQISYVSAGDNRISYVNVSNCSRLYVLAVYDNPLTDLDISNCPALLELYNGYHNGVYGYHCDDYGYYSYEYYTEEEKEGWLGYDYKVNLITTPGAAPTVAPPVVTVTNSQASDTPAGSDSSADHGIHMPIETKLARYVP